MKFARIAVEINLDRLFTYSVPEELLPALSPGARVRVPFGNRLLTGYIVDMAGEDLPGGVKPVHSAVEDFPVFTPGMISLAMRLSEHYIVPPGEVFKSMLPGRVKLKKEQCIEREPEAPAGLPDWLAPVECGFSAGGGRVFVIDGVAPGEESGVYAALSSACVKSGRQAAVLFPDMASLIRHERSFRNKLGARYGIYHGSMGAKEKRSVWEGARSGRLKAVLGLRSAVFSPFPSPGLIIVHDEADFSYKSRRQPRFNARDAALMRGEIEGCAVVLGGYFPSFETYRSVQTAEFSILKPGRTLPAGNPAVRIVDMRFERARIFSRILKQAVFSALDEKKQVLLFMNRRGYSNYFVCRECGFLKRCKNCSVCLRYHADSGRLLCHYCNYSEDASEICPACRKSYFKKSGFGTQQAEAMAGKIFRKARIARLDSDSAGVNTGEISILEKFKRGDIDILIDTGMAVNSGVFGNVSVCGIMAADNFLNMPDFRAAENLFRYVSRARACVGGGASLIIQTYNPGHYSMDSIKTFDRSGFYARESVIRKKLNYPPFGRICNIIISGRNCGLAEAASARFAGLLEEELPSGVEILGPVPAVVSKIRNMHRRQIVIKSASRLETAGQLRGFMRRAAEEKLLPAGVRVTIDVDPVNMF